MKAALIASLAIAVPPFRVDAQEPAGPATAVIAQEYWEARALWRYASNRTCAIEGFPRYDDAASPFRRNDERMRRIEGALEAQDAGVVARSRPRGPFPPAQLQCDDEDLARQALREYDTKVAEMERQLGLDGQGEG